MIISMCNFSKLIAVTNRKLCNNDFLQQIDKICALYPKSLILREKDLTKEEYFELARDVKVICEKYKTSYFIHSHIDIAKQLGCDSIHISLPLLTQYGDDIKEFTNISVSCHSIEDVYTAIQAGATQIILGNIFETTCKPGLSGKGLNFLKDICDKSEVPVYAIGGITLENLPEVLDTHAAGGCMMSGFMKL